jgi:hypothetical protein
MPPVLPSHAGFLKMAPKGSGGKTPKAATTSSAKQPMKAAGKKVAKSAMKAPPPETDNRRDRNKDRYLKQHKHELPQTIQKLLDDTGSNAQGKLINKLVVKDEHGGWKLKIDDSYVMETLRVLLIRCSRCQHVLVVAATGM